MDLIDRQAAIDILEVAINDDWEFDYAKDRMIELSAQPERKNGEWTIDEDCEGKSRTVTCNLCGHEEFNWHNPNFCPNCGADMRGEQE